MAHFVASALLSFTQRYRDAYQQKYQTFPCSTELAGLPSLCIQKQEGDNVYWQAHQREGIASLQAVEQGIELTLHSDIAPFYGSQYCADMPALWRDNALTLLQVWNEDDDVRLQENILGHLVMQRRLKQKPTIFIATTDDDMTVISICNLTGNVIRETLGRSQREVLCADVADFLDQLKPVV
ncbi:SecY-interacting protein [Vibrio cincinnatiensis]|uniref:SecY-interacting protein n=1 Tax=Vibrio cincinnatiensis TaxID=675 RepID=UPI001EDFD816|nr:SecY-interacting protein [Vibrio cincinnatiensis]MCG3743780.1 SecY-interacting protein [Vibrio cincinnatiensis]